MTNDLNQIWKALADETRRTILDFLRSGPKPTTAIVEQFPDLSRFAVMKHLDDLYAYLKGRFFFNRPSDERNLLHLARSGL